MEYWRTRLSVDPIPHLLGLHHAAIPYFVKRDLLDDPPFSVRRLWELPEAKVLVRRQAADGSWRYPGKRVALRSQEDYDQIETYRNLRILVEKYGFDRTHPSVQKAAEYFFTVQSPEGDFRGIYGTQYTPNYCAGIMELLIKSGYQDDTRIQHAFEWLLSMRQADGGWAIALRTLKLNYQQAVQADHPYLPDRSKRFSHLVTGVVLRAFAAHPAWRKSPVSQEGASLLAGRLFKPDAYIDRGTPEYWERVSFPFWFTDIVSALDSISLIGFKIGDSKIQAAVDWLAGKQNPHADFDLKIVRGRDKSDNYWIALAIYRIFKRYYQDFSS